MSHHCSVAKSTLNSPPPDDTAFSEVIDVINLPVPPHLGCYASHGWYHLMRLRHFLW